LALVPHLCLLMPRCVLPPPSFHWLSAPVPSASLLPLALVPHLLPLALLGLHFALLALSLRALCLPPTLCPWPLAPVPSASPLPPGTRAPPPCPWPFGPISTPPIPSALVPHLCLGLSAHVLAVLPYPPWL